MLQSSEDLCRHFVYFEADFVVEFDVLIVKSVLYRRFIVVGIVLKNYSRIIQELMWKEELYGHWEFINVMTFALFIFYISTSFGQ